MQFQTFKFIASYLAPFRLQITMALCSVVVVSSAILGLGYALKYLIDQGFVAHDLKHLNQAFILLIAIIILIAFASYNRSSKINWICQALENNIKNAAYKNILNISPSFFELNKISDVIARLTTDLGVISNTLVLIASFSLRNVLMAVGGMILLLVTNLKLTSYVLLILPIILLPLIIIGRKTKKLSKENQQIIADCNSHIEETLSYLKTVHSYNKQDFEYKTFLDLNDLVGKISYKRIKLRAILFSLVIALILSAVAFVLWVGGKDVLNGQMSAGSLSSFIFYAILVATSIGGFSEVYSDWQRANGALERVMEIINVKSPIKEITNTKKIDLQKIDLSINHLSFSYPTRTDSLALNDFSLEVKNGSKIAIVGASGAGKSTIFQLLLRFYDPISGNISLNGVDIKEISLHDLHEVFTFIAQDSVIFSDTAYNNILYGKIDANFKEVEEAAKAAEIFDFIDSLPQKFDTYLGEKGTKISGGQKQRIAIARAILRNPKILLLDEATSSLDNENEKLVQKALARLGKNKTTIVITHRISTVVNADLIIVLENGKIAGQGTHKELLQNNRIYQKLNQTELF